MSEEWWERFFDEEMGEVMFSATAWQRAEELCDSLVELLGIEPGARVLDLACGAGRFVLPLARRGFRVIPTAGARNKSSLRLFTLRELIEFLSEAGLKVLGYSGNLKGDPWSWEGSHSVIVAERA